MHSMIKRPDIIAIGTSTGGPKALDTILSQIDRECSIPILVVQHMPPGFTESLAARLNKKCSMNVVEATNKQMIQQRSIYIAPGDYHMGIIKKDDNIYIETHQDVPRDGHRPSYDVLLESMVNIDNLNVLCIVLTGMGHDGVNGISFLKSKATCKVLAQEKSTCVVYGMPKSIIEAGLADHILPLPEIANFINKTNR